MTAAADRGDSKVTEQAEPTTGLNELIGANRARILAKWNELLINKK